MCGILRELTFFLQIPTPLKFVSYKFSLTYIWESGFSTNIRGWRNCYL